MHNGDEVVPQSEGTGLSDHVAVIDQNWKRITVAGNAVLGALELASGGTATLSVAADGVHNIGDAVSYAVQSDHVLKHHEDTDARIQRRRKAVHWLISATSAGIALKAGVDLNTNTVHQAA